VARNFTVSPLLIVITAGSKTIMPSFPALSILMTCSSEKEEKDESEISKANTSFFMHVLYMKLIK